MKSIILPFLLDKEFDFPAIFVQIEKEGRRCTACLRDYNLVSKQFIDEGVRLQFLDMALDYLSESSVKLHGLRRDKLGYANYFRIAFLGEDIPLFNSALLSSALKHSVCTRFSPE